MQKDTMTDDTEHDDLPLEDGWAADGRYITQIETWVHRATTDAVWHALNEYVDTAQLSGGRSEKSGRPKIFIDAPGMIFELVSGSYDLRISLLRIADDLLAIHKDAGDPPGIDLVGISEALLAAADKIPPDPAEACPGATESAQPTPPPPPEPIPQIEPLRLSAEEIQQFMAKIPTMQIMSYPRLHAQAEQLRIHASCLALERLGYLRREHEENGAVRWLVLATPPAPAPD